MGECYPLPFSSFSSFSPFSPPSPAAKRLPENQLGGLGSSVICPSGVRGKAQAAHTFWCILSLKSYLAATFFFTNALRKDSYIGKKCRNDVQKFIPTKISGGFRISGRGIPPSGCICLEETYIASASGPAETIRRTDSQGSANTTLHIFT